MAKRHGILVETANEIQFKVGIWRIFDPWTYGSLLRAQRYNGRHEEARPACIKYHFNVVINRLFISLNRLYFQLREFDKFVEDGALGGSNTSLVFEIPEEIGIAADSVVHYLNLFAEDLARIIPFVLEEHVLEVDQKKLPPSLFNDLKQRILNDKMTTTKEIKDLFVSLEQNDNSWWSLSLKRGRGIRQRLVHYPDLIVCSASTKSGDSKMTSNFTLCSIDVSKDGVDTSEKNMPFEGTLKTLFYDLCNWLDDLEGLLLPILIERLAKKKVQWSPFDERVPTIRLLIPCADRFDVSKFFMPECD